MSPDGTVQHEMSDLSSRRPQGWRSEGPEAEGEPMDPNTQPAPSFGSAKPPPAEPPHFLTLKPSQTDGCYIWPGRFPTAIPNISPNTFRAVCAVVISEAVGRPRDAGPAVRSCSSVPSLCITGSRDPSTAGGGVGLDVCLRGAP